MKEKEDKSIESIDSMANDSAKIKMVGHILINDITDKENAVELVNKRNAIHYGNMSYFLANALAGKPHYDIHYMAFGNGGSIINSLGQITYKTTNIAEVPDLQPSSLMHSLQYFKIVDNITSSNLDTDRNKIEIVKNVTSYTDIKITCTLDFGEPSGQEDFDNSNGISNTDFVFDELGLFSLDISDGNEITSNSLDDFASKCYMLTHVIFHPIQKSLNRIIEVVYTLRILLN